MFGRKAKTIVQSVERGDMPEDIKSEAEEFVAEKQPSVDTMREFQHAILQLFPIMKSPLKSITSKRKALCQMVDKLTPETFNLFPMQIIEIVNKSEKICKQYPDTNAQVDGVLEWLPRMKEHRELLFEVIKERRTQYGMNT